MDPISIGLGAAGYGIVHGVVWLFSSSDEQIKKEEYNKGFKHGIDASIEIKAKNI